MGAAAYSIYSGASPLMARGDPRSAWRMPCHACLSGHLDDRAALLWRAGSSGYNNGRKSTCNSYIISSRSNIAYRRRYLLRGENAVDKLTIAVKTAWLIGVWPRRQHSAIHLATVGGR